MGKSTLFLLVTAWFLLMGSTSSAKENMPAPAESATERSSESGLVRHLVFFRYKPETSETDINMITRRFLALKQECKRDGKPYIVSLDAGLANSPEGADLGFTHGFMVTFKSEEDRNYYVGRLTAGKPGTALLKTPDGNDLFEPAHEQFKLDVAPFLYVPRVPTTFDGVVGNGVMVFDFTTDKYSK